MKTSRKTIIALFLFMATIVCPMISSSQEWSQEQKDVWKNVETYWDLATKGDIEGFLGYFHNDFSGWNYVSPLPDDRTTRVKYVKFFMPKIKTLFYNIQPLAIKIHGNIAIVHYSYEEVTKLGEEKEKFGQGRWTDILLKQDDKWVIIGDHGGAKSEKQ